MAQPPPQSQPSLSSLPSHLQNDVHITSHLASRFHLGLPTATISSHALLALNTFTSPNVASIELENMTSRMWRRLVNRGENQIVMFLGESGAGKTTLRSSLLSHLLGISSTPLSHKISLCAFLFDTLTTTKSTTTPTASKAGLFLELQYDGVSQTLIGGKLLDHRLERSRVTSVPTGERNFHVLYFLLAGTSEAEKEHLGLNSTASSVSHRHSGDVGGKYGTKRWRYLGHPTQLKIGINDSEAFGHFKDALRKLEFPRNEIAEICQILATILHIGQLEFTNTHGAVAGDESGAMEAGDQVVAVRNKDILATISAFLGVSPDALQSSLGYRTKTLNRERVTVMLDAAGARAHADELARTLYSLLVAWIIESCNERLCAVEDSVANTISIIDFPGFAQSSSTGSTLDQLLNNAATEALYNSCLDTFFTRRAELYDTEEIKVPPCEYFDNSDAVKGLLKPGNGLLNILDDQTRRGRTDAQFLDSLKRRLDSKPNPSITVGNSGGIAGTKFSANSFTVTHWAGAVDYPIHGLIEQNAEIISADLMNLFQGTSNNFVRELFTSKAVTTVNHPRERTAIMQGQLSSKPLRMPSVMRRKGDRKPKADPETPTQIDQGAAGQFVSSLDIITKALARSDTNPYFVFCLKPNDRRIQSQFDSKAVRSQIKTLGIAELSERIKGADFSVFLPFGEFLSLTESENIFVGSEREKVQSVLEQKAWPQSEACIGATGVFLSERCWSEIGGESGMVRSGGGYDTDEMGSAPITPMGDLHPGGPYGSGSDLRVRLIPNASPSGGMGSHIYNSDKGYFNKSDDLRSEGVASAFNTGDMFRNFDTRQQMAEKGQAAREEEIAEVSDTPSRKRWMFVVWMVTFFIPDFLLRFVGGMKRPDIRIAWREKLAINMMIWFVCACAVFVLVPLTMLICPKQDIYSVAELAQKSGGKDNTAKPPAYASLRGIVIDLTAFAPQHEPKIIADKDILAFGGKDVTNLFPVQVSALCNGKDGTINPYVQFNYKGDNATQDSTLNEYARYHDFRYFRNDSRPDWFYERLEYLRRSYMVGDMGYSAKDVSRSARKQSKDMAILNGKVYDLTEYTKGGRRIAPGNAKDLDVGAIDVEFMDGSVVALFTGKAGTDITKSWEALNLSPDLRRNMMQCLDNLFYIGKVDTRNSTQCQFSNYLLLSISILLCSVIGFKFFAALQFGKENMPENLDKFIICQVPAYTEDEDSLRRAIDSVARMKYDDKRKLLVVVCDGMIIGQGNDRSTPRIVLDILGVPDTTDPEPLSFESLGEGKKQHNMGKVYSGLYETHGHIVPFLVLVKVGTPEEVGKPGNRGKRDSQMVLMRFLNRVHYNEPMAPLELEMHHQIRNIIGVNPTFYEFILQIDADTEVGDDSATRMVAAFLADTRIIALCGETGLTNARHSFITMIQVYEYYISHNLSKAFESLFGSVTCLPGCFSMYRIRAAETGKPLFVSKEVVEAYAEIRVDTLHMKNLLHLGEDRYLTTLLLKFHSRYRTKYLFHAHANTIAPDSWAVFLSQRRRWINSTLHNLAELVPMQQLCGFCCFSMRFVVFLDLLSTVVAPVTVAYIGYLIYMVSSEDSKLPVWSFILLAAVYGLQAFIFIMRRKWEMVGWMILYIIAIPVFSFALPLYSFWHMDDFSWGNTRLIQGEDGKKKVISDEGKFDPSSIPRQKWEDYQAGLWEAQTQRGGFPSGDDDTRSQVSGYSYATKTYAPAQSEYGYGPLGGGGFNSRPVSQMDFPMNTMGGGMRMASQSRMSIAPSEMMSQRGSYMPDVEMSNLDLPSNDELLFAIREILKRANLMTVTKKSIKHDLEQQFGVNLDAKRMYINSATEAILADNL